MRYMCFKSHSTNVSTEIPTRKMTDETVAYCAAAATWTGDRLPGGLNSLHKKCSLCLELMQADGRPVICSRWQKLATGGIKQCYRMRGLIITLALQSSHVSSHHVE